MWVTDSPPPPPNMRSKIPKISHPPFPAFQKTGDHFRKPGTDGTFTSFHWSKKPGNVPSVPELFESSVGRSKAKACCEPYANPSDRERNGGCAEAELAHVIGPLFQEPLLVSGHAQHSPALSRDVRYSRVTRCSPRGVGSIVPALAKSARTGHPLWWLCRR